MDKASLSVVWKSSLLRYGPHALRSGLGAELRLTLVAFLTELKGSQPDVYDLLEAHRGGGFAEVRADDYAMAIDMVRSLARERALQRAACRTERERVRRSAIAARYLRAHARPQIIGFLHRDVGRRLQSGRASACLAAAQVMTGL